MNIGLEGGGGGRQSKKESFTFSSMILIYLAVWESINRFFFYQLPGMIKRDSNT